MKRVERAVESLKERKREVRERDTGGWERDIWKRPRVTTIEKDQMMMARIW